MLVRITFLSGARGRTGPPSPPRQPPRRRASVTSTAVCRTDAGCRNGDLNSGRSHRRMLPRHQKVGAVPDNRSRTRAKAKRLRSPAAAAGEPSCLEKPTCRRGQVQRLVIRRRVAADCRQRPSVRVLVRRLLRNSELHRLRLPGVDLMHGVHQRDRHLVLAPWRHASSYWKQYLRPISSTATRAEPWGPVQRPRCAPSRRRPMAIVPASPCA